MPRIRSGLLFSCSLLLACNMDSTSTRETNATPTLPEPDPQLPIQLQARLVQERVFRPGEDIILDVSITNVSDRMVAVCVEDWPVQKGLIGVDAYDKEGKPVKIVSEVDARFDVTKDRDTRVLAPRETVSGTMNALKRQRVYEFSRGSYYLVVKYLCPFSGTVKEKDSDVPIVKGKQRSNAVRIRVDYR